MKRYSATVVVAVEHQSATAAAACFLPRWGFAAVEGLVARKCSALPLRMGPNLH